MKYYDNQPACRTLFDQWQITMEDWSCQWEDGFGWRKLFVPKGYIFDGASIPRIAWTALGIPPHGEVDAAALAHDALYRAQGGNKPDEWKGCIFVNQNGNNVIAIREEVDWVFREFCIYATIARHRARIAWFFVRAFGKRYWGNPPPSGQIPDIDK